MTIALDKILSDCRSLRDDLARTLGSEAADLRDRLKVEHDAYVTTIQKRVRSWNSTEGEAVAAMKVRAMKLGLLIRTLDDLATAHEALDGAMERL